MVSKSPFSTVCCIVFGSTLAACAAKPVCPEGGGCHATSGDPIRLTVSDLRAKQDIRQIGTAENGLPIYLFRYKGEETWRVGVMAQDVLEQSPEAVSTTEDGYYAVNYGRIAW